jgi:hypothetical protein
VCRGEEDGVKGRDRVAAALPPLTPPAPRLCSIYPGMSAGFLQRITPSKINFAFIKSKNRLAQLFLKKRSDDSLHLPLPKLRLNFADSLDAIERRPQ